MPRRLFPALAVVLLYPLFCISASVAAGSEQDQPQLFTNQDLGKYKSSSVSGTTETVSREDRGAYLKDKKERIMEEREMEYWCKKASAYKKKIEKADEDVKEIEKELSGEKSMNLHAGKKNTRLQKRLEKAKEQVRDAEAALDELEHEAHRKGVPPGWLRCQT